MMRRQRSRLACAIVGCAVSAAPPSAAARRERFGASNVHVAMVSAGNSSAAANLACPSEEGFLNAVRRSVSEAPAGQEAPPAEYEITITTTASSARAVLVARALGAEHALERAISASTCREAAEAIALVLVGSINPLAPAVSFSPEPGAELRATEVDAVRPALRSPRAERRPALAAPKRERKIALGARALGGVITGIFPAAAPIIEAELTLRVAGFPAELHLGGGGILPVDLVGARGSVAFWSFRSRAAICPTWHHAAQRPWLSLGICAGGALDAITTRSSGYRQEVVTTALVPSLTGGAFGAVVFGPNRRFYAGVDAEIGVVLASTRWEVVASGEAHRTSFATLRVAGFIGMQFL